MEPYCENDRSQAGLSLVELLIVILVISVVAALALMQRGSANEQFQRQNAARELKVAFERARFDSVKRRADGSGTAPFAHVEVAANAITLRTYNVDVNGGPVAQDQTIPVPAGVTIEGYNFALGSSKQVTFNRRGEANVVGGGEPQFMVCNGVCPDEPGNSSVSNTVLVTPTGTVNLLPGGIAVPAFTNPTISTVTPTDGIKDTVIVP